MKTRYRSSVAVLGALCVLGAAFPAIAATSINLGSADSYAVLAGSTVTNTGTTVINGDLGLSPGTSVTGFPPGIINGQLHAGDAAAALAQISLTGAFLAASQPTTSTIPAELGGTTRTPGVFESSNGTFAITGTLTLDAQGDPSAVFIFKSATTLITAASSNVVLLNGAQACNVFWQVGSSVTLGVNSNLKGTVLAEISGTVTTGASVEGRILTRGGAVTLDTTTITRPSCVAPVATPLPSATTTPTVLATSTATVFATSTATVFATTTPQIIFASSTPPILFATTTNSNPFTPTPLTPAVTTITPSFPDTGFSPEENLSVLDISALLLVLISILSVLFLPKADPSV